MNLFRIRGIQLAVHASFLPLLAYVAWEGWRSAAGFSLSTHWLALGWSVAYVLLIFVCVTLHELGHSFMARRFGVGVPRILLLPIGGMAQFDSIPRRPRSEILIALAGPAVNFVLIGLLMIFIRFPSHWNQTEFPLTLTELLRHLVLINLVMGLFNLVPVFPMDGGRVFRALLATRLPYLRATRIAANTGKVIAVTALVSLIAWAQLHRQWAEAVMPSLLIVFIFVAGEIEWRAVRRSDLETEHWQTLRARLHPVMPAEPDTTVV